MHIFSLFFLGISCMQKKGKKKTQNGWLFRVGKSNTERRGDDEGHAHSGRVPRTRSMAPNGGQSGENGERPYLGGRARSKEEEETEADVLEVFLYGVYKFLYFFSTIVTLVTTTPLVTIHTPVAVIPSSVVTVIPPSVVPASSPSIIFSCAVSPSVIPSCVISSFAIPPSIICPSVIPSISPSVIR